MRKAAALAAQSGLLPGMPPDAAAAIARAGAQQVQPQPNAGMPQDQGALALAPNGTGAAPISQPMPGAPGGQGINVPFNAGMAGVQSLQ
jgi:hypothetical protein